MFAYKKLKSSDAGILAFEAHKEYNINETNQSSFGVSLTNTQYSSASRDTYSSFSNDPFNHKRYFQLDHLFYKDPIFDLANLNNGINYIDQEKRLYDKANIISISQKNTGNGIQKGTVTLNGSFIDDKKGNIYDSLENLDDYPKDKDRVFYLAPVKGFKYTDLTRDAENGELVVNAPTTLEGTQIDDSLYTNPIEYISCSIKHMATNNCTGVDLNTGYIKVPHSNNYNFNDDDFTISFYYDADDTSGTYHLFSKSFTQTVAGTPPFPKLTENSGSFDKQEVDAGSSYPFEILVDGGNIIFRRSDGNTISSVSTALSSGLEHYAFIKNSNRISIIKGDTTTSSDDITTVCRNKADLFIGSHGGTRNDVGNARGIISQMMIFNKALSSTQITNVKNSITGTPYIGNVFYEQGFITITSPKVTNTTLTNTVLKDFNTSIGVSAGTIDDNYFIRSEGNVPRFSGSLTFVNEEFTNQINSIESLASALVPDNIFTVVENLAKGSALDIGLDTNAGGEYDPSFTISSTTKILPIFGVSNVQEFNKSGVQPVFSSDLNNKIAKDFSNRNSTNITPVSKSISFKIVTSSNSRTLNNLAVSASNFSTSSVFSASIAAGVNYQSTQAYHAYISGAFTFASPNSSELDKYFRVPSGSINPSNQINFVLEDEYIIDENTPSIFISSESLFTRIQTGIRTIDNFQDPLYPAPSSPDVPTGRRAYGLLNRNFILSPSVFPSLTEATTVTNVIKYFDFSAPGGTDVDIQTTIDGDLTADGMIIHEAASGKYGNNGVDTVLVYPLKGRKEITTLNIVPLERGIQYNTFKPYMTIPVLDPISSAKDLATKEFSSLANNNEGDANPIRFTTTSLAMYTDNENSNYGAPVTIYDVNNIANVGTVTQRAINPYYADDYQSQDWWNIGPETKLSRGSEAFYSEDDSALYITASLPSVSLFSTSLTEDNTNVFNAADPTKKIEGEIIPYGYVENLYNVATDRYFRIINFGNITDTDEVHLQGDNIASMDKPITKLSDIENDIRNLLPIGCGFSGTSANEIYLKFDSDAAGLISDGIRIQGLTELDPPEDGNSFPKGLTGKFIPPKKLKLKVIFDAQNPTPEYTQYLEVTLRKKTDSGYDSVVLYNNNSEQYFTFQGRSAVPLSDNDFVGVRSSFRSDIDEGVAVAHPDYKRYVWTCEIDIDDYNLVSTDELFPVVKLSSPNASTEGTPVAPTRIRNLQFGVYDVEKPTNSSVKAGYQNVLEIASEPINIPANTLWRCSLKNLNILSSSNSSGLNQYLAGPNNTIGSIPRNASLLVSLRAYPYFLESTVLDAPQGTSNIDKTINTSIVFDNTATLTNAKSGNAFEREDCMVARIFTSGSSINNDIVLSFFNDTWEHDLPGATSDDDLDTFVPTNPHTPVTQYRLFISVVEEDGHPNHDSKGFFSGYKHVNVNQGSGFSMGDFSSSYFPLGKGPYIIHQDSAANVEAEVYNGYAQDTLSNYEAVFAGTSLFGQYPLVNLRGERSSSLEEGVSLAFGVEAGTSIKAGFVSGRKNTYIRTLNSLGSKRTSPPNILTQQYPKNGTYGNYTDTLGNSDSVLSTGTNFGIPNTNARIVPVTPLDKSKGELYAQNVIGGANNEYVNYSNSSLKTIDSFPHTSEVNLKNIDYSTNSVLGSHAHGRANFDKPVLLIGEWNVSKNSVSSQAKGTLALSKQVQHFITASIGPFTASGITSEESSSVTLNQLIVGDRRRDNYTNHYNQYTGVFSNEGIENDPSGIGSNNFIQVDLLKDGVKVFNRLIPGQTPLIDVTDGAPEDDLDLGLVNKDTQFKIEYKVVSALDVPVRVPPVEFPVPFTYDASEIGISNIWEFGGMFNGTMYEASSVFNYMVQPCLRIGPFSISAATSSKTITRLDGPLFPQLEDTVEGTYKVSFSSSMKNTGSANLPFTTGSVEVNVLSVNEDGTQIIVDQDMFITASMIAAGESTFDLSVIDPQGNPSDPPRPLLKVALPINFKSNTEAVHELISSNGTVKLLNRTDDVLGFRVLDINNTIIHQGKFNDNGAGVLSQIDNKSITTPNVGEGKLLLFITGAASDLYPDGIISSSADNLKINIAPVASRLGLSTKTISGSFISSKIGKTLSASELESNNLLVSSSHSGTGTHGLFNTGNTEKVISQYVLDGGEHRIRTNEILFITASSEATGTKAEFTYYTYKNPINIGDAPPAELVGGSFDYSDPVSGQTVSYKITGISGNSITLDNLNATPGNGIIAIEPSDISTRYVETTNAEFNLQFKNTHLIFENEFHCTVDENEFNHTLNASARKYKSIEQGELADFATDPKFRPYVTTVGLYNDEGELLVVGKLAQPVKTSTETDTTFVVRYDT